MRGGCELVGLEGAIRLRPGVAWVMAAVIATLVSCGDPQLVGNVSTEPNVRARQSVVWLGAEGLDPDTAAQLKYAGVDEVVARFGSISLSAEVSVPTLVPLPPIAGDIPVGLALRVQGSQAPDSANTRALWHAMAARTGNVRPAELLLDMPSIPEGADEFVVHLTREAGVPVTPILTPSQLGARATQRLVAAAGGCVVPVFGEIGMVRDGAVPSTNPLVEQLAPLAGTGARVRVGIVLMPVTQPPLGSWGEDLNPLTEGSAVDSSPSSGLDRSFVFREPMAWSGRQWRQGAKVEVRWIDAARLHRYLAECGHMGLPELGGWDFIALPPAPIALGMGRETLWRFLAGEGPKPDIHVSVGSRRGEPIVTIENRSPFATALSSFGNWVELAIEGDYLVAQERGDFDRIDLGVRRGGSWESSTVDNINSVRLFEFYLGPHESVTSGPIRLGRRASDPVVRWRMVLHTGEVLDGMLETE